MTGEDFTIHSKQIVNVNIGGWFVTSGGEQITTLLGSCVAVCLYDTEHPAGGMNHILLPGDADLNRATPSARYGVHAMELLVNGLIKEGACRKRLVAKFFGGASILGSISDTFGMGERNVRFVREFLQLEKIPVISSDVGGRHSRRIFFNTDTREVLMKKPRHVLDEQIRMQENEDYTKIKKEIINISGEVDLFS